MSESTRDGAPVTAPAPAGAEGAAAPPVGRPDPADPTWARLEGQLAWYDDRAGRNQRWYERLKLLELVIAAGLPVAAGLAAPAALTAGLAASVVVLEGVQHLQQFQQRWLSYRSTAEALQRERALYLAAAGPYRREDRHRRLAERVERVLAQERTSWRASFEEDDEEADREV
jgi:hypothetical protein